MLGVMDNLCQKLNIFLHGCIMIHFSTAFGQYLHVDLILDIQGVQLPINIIGLRFG